MASPCVRPRGLKRGKNGQFILPPGYKFRKKPGRKKGGVPCIVKAKSASAPKRKAASKKRASAPRRAAASTARPCPRGSYRVKKGKGRGTCRKLHGAAAAAAAGKKVGFMRGRGRSGIKSNFPDYMNFYPV